MKGNANVLPSGGSPPRSLLDLYAPHKSADKLSCKPLRTAAFIDHALQTRCIGQLRFSHIQTPAQRSRLFLQTMQRGIKAVLRKSACRTVQVERIASEMDTVSDQIAEQSRKEAEAAAKAAAAAKAQKKNSSGSSPVTTTGSGSATRYSGTFTWPLPGYTNASSAYGWRTHPIFGTRKFHKGEDIPAPTGVAIVAAASGTVTTAGWVSGYGNYTVINHGGGVMTAYGHQSAIYVSVGQTVSAGQTIGAVGSTGNSTGPHLHFEVYVNGATQNPMSYFS